MQIITRKDAKNSGNKYYFTGTPCKNGHFSKRQVSTYVCHKCSLERSARWRSKNVNYHMDYNKSYYLDNKDRTKKHSTAYYSKMKETKLDVLRSRQRANSRNYIANNKEIVSKRDKEWRSNNHGIQNAFTAKRRARKLNATPVWANKELIKSTYVECEEINIINKMCGGSDVFVVDHIIPLQGKFVSGLHIESNLQIITAFDNAQKANKFNEEDI
jgi:hypothetical protein